MAEIVNLNQFRKNRRRADKERMAAENRVLHGRSKASRQADGAETESVRRGLDARKLDRPDGEDEV